VVLTNSGVTLAGVTLAAGATIDATQLNAVYPQNSNYANVTGGLYLGAANGSTFGQLRFLGTQALVGSGTVVFGGSPCWASRCLLPI
jgi:hypothetical protein